MLNITFRKILLCTVIAVASWSSLAVGPMKCDYTRCVELRDGTVVCPEGACVEIPPVKGKP
jgi:hypothetical protein